MSNIIEKLVIEVGFDAKGAVSGLKTLNQDFQKTKSESRNLAREMSRDGDQAAQFFSKVRNEAILLFGLFTAGKGLKSFVSDTIQSTAQLGFFSDTIGQTTEQITELQLAAERMGGSKAGIAGMIAGYAQDLSDLRSQGKGILSGEAGWFGYLNQGGKDTNSLKSGLDVLLAQADVLKHISETRTEGDVLNYAAANRISPENIPLMRQGSEAILKQMDAMKALATVSKEDAARMQDFNREILNIKDSFSSTGTEILIQLVPALKQALSIFKDLGSWFNKHKDEIAQTLGEWSIKATEFIKSMFGDEAKIGKILDVWSDKFDRLVNSLEKLARAAGIINDTYKFFNPDEYKPDATRPRKQSSGLSNIIEEYAPAVKGFFTGSPEKQLKDASIKHGFDYNKVRGAFADASKQYGVSESLLMAQAYQESGFNPKIRSKAGATGFSQFMPDTAKRYGLDNPNDPVQSIFAQAHYMSDLQKKFGGRTDLALAGYNAGENRKSLQAGIIPNIPETIGYVKRITALNEKWSGSTGGSTDKSINMQVGTVNVKADDTKGFMDDMLKQSNMRANLFTQYNTGM